MGSTLDPGQLARYDALELVRVEKSGDFWESAWEAVDLAAAIERASLKAPTAESIGLLWGLYRVATACERWLAEEGRTTADDNGDTAPVRISGYLGHLCGRALQLAQE